MGEKSHPETPCHETHTDGNKRSRQPSCPSVTPGPMAEMRRNRPEQQWRLVGIDRTARWGRIHWPVSNISRATRA